MVVVVLDSNVVVVVVVHHLVEDTQSALCLYCWSLIVMFNAAFSQFGRELTVYSPMHQMTVAK